MNDETLEVISLLTIMFGLVIAFFFVLDYEPVDAFYLNSDDSNAYFSGEIMRKSFNNESGYSHLEIKGCRTFDAFYEGVIETEGNISFSGELREGKFTIKTIN